MKVSVFGTGNMGRAIGTRLVSGGNDVQVLATEPQNGAELVEELRGKAASGAGVVGRSLRRSRGRRRRGSGRLV
jgi:predicted dinucleotide-binding enzyme